MLSPVGEFVLCSLEPLPQASSIIALVNPKEPPGRSVAVLVGSGEFQMGDRLIVSMRQAIQVGEDLLVPYSGILARLGIL